MYRSHAFVITVDGTLYEDNRNRDSCSLSRIRRFQLPASLRAIDSVADAFHESASRVGCRVYGHAGGLTVRERYILAEKRELHLKRSREECEESSRGAHFWKELTYHTSVRDTSSTAQYVRRTQPHLDLKHKLS